MDHESFDRFVRLLGTPGSRRAALAAFFGSAAGGVAAAAAAKDQGKGKHRDKKRQQDKKHKRQHQPRPAKDQAKTDSPAGSNELSAQAAPDCANPGPSKNLQNCNYNGQNRAGLDVSSSNLKNARFNGTNLCGADLSSATLTNVDFRNANLTRADLHSSGCNGVQTNGGTTFCQTIMCNGTVRNDDCPGAAPNTVCCAAANCAERVCEAASCTNNLCAYADQDDGGPGTLCPAPRECCNGGCCPEGQKCCDGACIPNATCCASDCAANEKCCGPNCIADTICCTDGVSGTCPPNQQCCVDQGTNFPADDDGGTCKQAIGQTCSDPNHPELDCCFPDFCCQNEGNPGPQCKAGSGKPCIGNDDCCNDAGLFCAAVNGTPVCCIPTEGESCNPSVTPCCSPLVCDEDDFKCVAPD